MKIACHDACLQLLAWPSSHSCNKIVFNNLFTLLQINVNLKSEMPVQIDGEPWMQGAGNVIVRPILTQVLLLIRVI